MKVLNAIEKEKDRLASIFIKPTAEVQELIRFVGGGIIEEITILFYSQ